MTGELPGGRYRCPVCGCSSYRFGQGGPCPYCPQEPPDLTVVDEAVSSDEQTDEQVVRTLRRMGAAAWRRDRQHGGMDPHCHLVLPDCLGQDASEPLRDRLRFRWWKVRDWFRRCPECRRRGYGAIGPRWEDDKVARMLGIDQYGCRCCGKGAIEERDRSTREGD